LFENYIVGGKVAIPLNTNENLALTAAAKSYAIQCQRSLLNGKTVWIGASPTSVSGVWSVCVGKEKCCFTCFIFNLFLQGLDHSCHIELYQLEARIWLEWWELCLPSHWRFQHWWKMVQYNMLSDKFKVLIDDKYFELVSLEGNFQTSLYCVWVFNPWCSYNLLLARALCWKQAWSNLHSWNRLKWQAIF